MKETADLFSKDIIPTVATYYLTLIAIFVASLFPEHRVWGLNLWAYYPDWVRWGLLGVGTLVPVILRFILPKEKDDNGRKTETALGDRKFFLSAGITIVGLGSLFYLLRARAHFLGDGYTLLSSVANDNIIAVKTREIGESLVHIWLKNAIGGDAQAAAQLSFQIISITAGLLFVVVVALFAQKLFERTAERLLFLFGVCTGGYMLLYFGYVENYSLFVFSVLTYTLTGLLVGQGKVSRYWLLPPLMAAVFFHVMGVPLLPSALYLWIGPSRIGQAVRKGKPLVRLVAAISIMVVGGAVFYYFYTASYFFRFAFLPLVDSRFTVEGYTMFSMNHLVDVLNMLLLLVPGLLMVIASLPARSIRHTLKQRPLIYLLILMSSVVGAIFIFEPKLGMPRDWDLFSFAGVPSAVLCYYLLLKLKPHQEYARSIAALSIALGCLILIPRAVGQTLPDIAVARFKYHASLDRSRNMNARTVLQEYLRQQGDTLALKQDVQLFRSEYPEWTMNERGLKLGEAGRYDQAIPLFQRALQLNPGFWSAYANLGWCYLRTNQVDSAVTYLEWSDGMNPRGSRINYRLGAAYLVSGDYDRADIRLRETLELDSTEVEALAGLVVLYRTTGQTEEMLSYLTRLTEMEEADPAYTTWLGDYYLQSGRFEDAAAAYRRAIDRGVDSTFMDGLLAKYPLLKAAWR